MKKLFCVIGLPSSGKSYFCKALAKARGYSYISTGDLARSLMKDEAQRNKTAELDLFPDETKLRDNLLVTINSKPDGIVLVDGFPRSADQVVYMTNALWHWFPEVIHINAGEDVTLLARARARARDSVDEDVGKFAARLAKAKLNQSGVYNAMNARSLRWHTILSGDLEAMYNQFDLVNK